MKIITYKRFLRKSCIRYLNDFCRNMFFHSTQPDSLEFQFSAGFSIGIVSSVIWIKTLIKRVELKNSEEILLFWIKLWVFLKLPSIFEKVQCEGSKYDLKMFWDLCLLRSLQFFMLSCSSVVSVPMKNRSSAAEANVCSCK